MNIKHQAILLSGCIAITACSGGGSSSSSGAADLGPITSIELLDPDPGATNYFGTATTVLPNGNIVVTSPGDGFGAVHLYSPRSQVPICAPVFPLTSRTEPALLIPLTSS